MPKASAALAHQFDDAEQQRQASTLGMWVFLATEIMFFGGMFLGYIVYRSAYPAAFAAASNRLDIRLGALNTAVLICSSFTMVLAVANATAARPRALVRALCFTIVLGCAFLGIKLYEYHSKFEQHLVPGSSFVFSAPLSAPAEIFFSFYFAMTGMHAAHMIIGIALLASLAVGAARGRYSPDYFTPVELIGLYWHFVDIVWIFLFPILYLVGRHV